MSIVTLNANTTPAQARAAYRAGLKAPTAGIAHGFAQANLITLPADDAADFLEFAKRNPKPCPLLDVTAPGSVTSRLTRGGDLRTDIPGYRIWHRGEITEEVTDASEAWATRDDLVSFVIGCSFTFEFPLLDAGVPVRHITAGTNVPMYETSIPCEPAGKFASPLIVSMRGIPADQVDTAVQVSARYPAVHGAPVHIGDPDAIGIRDLFAPEHGDPPVLNDGDVPVFWACGVTPQAAVTASKPDFAITHLPGHMLITDARDSDYLEERP